MPSRIFHHEESGIFFGGEVRYVSFLKTTFLSATAEKDGIGGGFVILFVHCELRLSLLLL